MRIAFALACAGLWFDLWPLRRNLLSRDGNFGGASSELPFQINVFQWLDAPLAVDACFVVVAAAILGLLAGLWQRASAIVTYVWIASYSASAGLALGGFDTVARLVAFVVMLSPTSSRWSLDRRPAAPVPRYGLRLLQWQLLVTYWVTVWLKAPDSHWRQGDIISHFMLSMFSRFPDPRFAELGIWDPLLTWGTLVIELLTPLLLFCAKTRWLGFLLGLGLHLSIAVVGKLGLFLLAMLPLYLAFLEEKDFVALGDVLRRFRRERAILERGR